MKLPSFWRYQLILVGLSFLGLTIVVQILRIQASKEADYFRSVGEDYSHELRVLEPKRGEIYDRRGNPLASNTEVYEIGVDLGVVSKYGNARSIAESVNQVVGVDYAETLGKASMLPTDQNVYQVLANFVPAEKKDALEQLKDRLANDYRGSDDPILAGLVWKPHLMRTYPEKTLAANILGFIDHFDRAYYGVEQKHNELLAGNRYKVVVRVPLDPNMAPNIPDVRPGASLILTIDREVQRQVEDILDKAVSSSKSDAGTIVVIDPKTGEILAMASTPRMDLNQYWDISSIYSGQTPFNRAISASYESGSVFKVLTMAAALDSGVVKPDTPFLDTGVYYVDNVPIYDWNRGAWGPQDMIGCLKHSLNVCLAWVAVEKLGTTRFYDYMQRFGLGQLTGVDLAGEVPGRLKLPGDSDWYPIDLATNSFGQGLAVTPIQMVAAVSAVANNGQMVTPHIVRSVVDNGRQFNTTIQTSGNPISAETAHTLSEMLAVSIETEASNRATIEGYRIAGKTGTGEIPNEIGYVTGDTNASFVGWGPVDDPRFLVYVWLERPQTSRWGSEVASPVFADVVKKLVVLMDIPPDRVRHQMAKK